MRILIICFLLLFGTMIQSADAQADCSGCPLSSDIDKSLMEVKLDSKFEINELGRLLIDYRITFTNSLINPGIVFNQPVSFYLPKEYENKISAYDASSEILHNQDISYINELVIISQSKRNTIVTIDFRNTNFAIQQGEDVGITLKLIITDVVELTEQKGLYKVLIPETTTTNFNLDPVTVEIFVPETATYANISQHYTRTGFQIFDKATTVYPNIKPIIDQKFTYFFLTETDGSNAFSKVKVEEIVREIFIAKNGEIMIKENLKLTNNGFFNLN